MAAVAICSDFGTRMLKDVMNISVLERGKKNSYHRYVKVKEKVAQSCPTLCNPMDYPVHGILLARILKIQGIFPTQRLNPSLLCCGHIFLPAEP